MSSRPHCGHSYHPPTRILPFRSSAHSEILPCARIPTIPVTSSTTVPPTQSAGFPATSVWYCHRRPQNRRRHLCLHLEMRVCWAVVDEPSHASYNRTRRRNASNDNSAQSLREQTHFRSGSAIAAEVSTVKRIINLGLYFRAFCSLRELIRQEQRGLNAWNVLVVYERRQGPSSHPLTTNLFHLPPPLQRRAGKWG